MHHIKNVLTKDEVAEVVKKLKNVEFEDGKKTASGAARAVKNNQQLTSGASTKDEATKKAESNKIIAEVTNKLGSYNPFVNVAFPKRFTSFMFNRYEVGMNYGSHLDTPIFANGSVRTDLSVTLFLSEPDTYDGGELIVSEGMSKFTVKMPAGDAFVYPSGSFHEVTPITSGVRLALVGWVESHIRQEDRRRILAELAIARSEFDKTMQGNIGYELFKKNLFNLMRMWWDD